MKTGRLWMSVAMASLFAVSGAQPQSVPLATKSASSVEARFAEAMRLSATGQLDDAIRLLEQVVKEEPRATEAQQQLAALYVRRGDLTKAVVPLRAAVALRTSDARLQEQLGDLYVELASGAYEAAVAASSRTAPVQAKYKAIKQIGAGVRDVHEK